MILTRSHPTVPEKEEMRGEQGGDPFGATEFEKKEMKMKLRTALTMSWKWPIIPARGTGIKRKRAAQSQRSRSRFFAENINLFLPPLPRKAGTLTLST